MTRWLKTFLLVVCAALALVAPARAGTSILVRGPVAAGSVTPIDVQVLWRLNAGTDGNILTLANINAGLLGASAFTASRTPFNHTKRHDFTPITLPIPLRSAGVTVSSVSASMLFDQALGISEGADPVSEGVVLAQGSNYSAGLDEYAFGALVKVNPTFGTNNVNYDLINFEGSGFDFPQWGSRASSVDLTLHGSGGASVLAMQPSKAKYYYVSGLRHGSKITVELLDLAAGQSAGAIEMDATITDLSSIKLQDYALAASGGMGTGGTVEIALFALREATDVFPFWNYVAPTPTTLARSQTGVGEVTVTGEVLTPQFEVKRKVDAGAYSSLGTFDTADHATTGFVGGITYVDTGLTNGTTVTHQIFAKTVGHTSAVGQVSAIVIDDAPFMGLEADDFPSLVRWFKVDALTGLANSDPISTGTDFSGNGNHLTQTGGARPTYVTNVTNGLPGAFFANGSTQSLVGSAITSAGSEKTWFVVIQPVSISGIDVEVLGTNTNNSYYRYSGDGNGYFGPFRANRINGYPTGMPTTGVHVIAGVSTASGYRIWIDSVAQSSQTADYSDGTTFTLGTTASNGLPWNGYIFEYCEYNAAMNPTDVVALSDALAGKW